MDTKKLDTIPYEEVRPYDPSQFPIELEELQTITVYFPPRFIMSPRIRLYRPEDIQTFKGYLKGFKIENVVNGEVEAPITVTFFEENTNAEGG